MTQADSLTKRPSAPRLHRSQAGKFASVAVLIIALLLTGVMQHVSREARADLIGPSVAQSRIGNLDSFALSLVLGGLRGPLVMALWSDIENQKSAKNLENIDTEIELVRLLQSDFDSVHIFQIWNKAYNISAQRINLANKYAEVLDALRYARSVDDQRPDDINIVMAMGLLYQDKLGGSQQKDEFRQRVRKETKFDPAWKKAEHQTETRPTRLEPLLDLDGNLTADALKHYPRLKAFEPFPDGVSTYAIAYSLLEHTRDLMVYDHQQHLQMSDVVVDSRPALALKAWFDEEVQYARSAEADAFGREVPTLASDEQTRHSQLDTLCTDVSLPVVLHDSKRLHDALFCYERALVLAPMTIERMKDHGEKYKNMFDVYSSPRLELAADMEMIRGDRDFLASTLDSKTAAPMLISAADHYRKAATRFRGLALRFYVDESVARRCGYVRDEIPAKVTGGPSPFLQYFNSLQLVQYMNNVQSLYYQQQAEHRQDFDQHPDEWMEYTAAINRCMIRTVKIAQALGR